MVREPARWATESGKFRSDRVQAPCTLFSFRAQRASVSEGRLARRRRKPARACTARRRASGLRAARGAFQGSGRMPRCTL